MKIDYTKYLYSLIITIAIFATAIFASKFFNNQRVENVKSIQDNIAINILSTETQFDLLKEVPCSNLDSNILSDELSKIGERLSYLENNRGADDSEVIYLKKYYSLLEIKDYLLTKRLSEKCVNKKIAYVIYIYSNNKNCETCNKQSLVLTAMREKYPELRVYSFDYDLDLSAIETLKKAYKVPATFPIIIIDDKVMSGYMDKDVLDAALPLSIKSTTTKSTMTKSATTSTTNKKIKTLSYYINN